MHKDNEISPDVENLRSQVKALEDLLQVHEETVCRQHAILHRTIEDLLAAKEAVQAADKAKSEFLANMSHEIRTPMTAILGFCEVLRENATEPQDIEALNTIKQNGNHLLTIINDILDLSKIEAGKMELERVACSPCRIIFEAVSLMRVKTQAKNLALNIAFAGPLPETIQSDAVRLRQIIINLIGNAVKFTDRGNVTLSAALLADAPGGTKVQFKVADTGIGMNEKEIAALFEPFSQADATTSRRFGGTGLGLAISKRLAAELGGDITVASVPGRGSTFTLTVDAGPLENVKIIDNPSECFQNLQTPPAPAAAPVHIDCRVLLAEDGPDNQLLISHFLRKAGAKVTVAENGAIACSLAMNAWAGGNPFDVILMDMQMPEMDGYEATKKLRGEGFDLPIIALTAHAMRDDKEKCLQAGCDDYLAKPLKREDLLALVDKYAEIAQNRQCVPADK